MTEFMRVEQGSWLSDDGRFEVYFALLDGRAQWKVWDADKGCPVDDGSHSTRAEATMWLLSEYAAA